MQRTIRFLAVARNTNPLIVVSTSRSAWNPFVWFGCLPAKTTVAYHLLPGGTIEDFHGIPVSSDLLKEILDKAPVDTL